MLSLFATLWIMAIILGWWSLAEQFMILDNGYEHSFWWVTTWEEEFVEEAECLLEKFNRSWEEMGEILDLSSEEGTINIVFSEDGGVYILPQDPHPILMRNIIPFPEKKRKRSLINRHRDRYYRGCAVDEPTL